ncbi:MAG: Undecaprenyl-phosphate mannosyltransferase [Parcubacteria group bacterium ADurb.Bin316]|nr:MAG: Undecaprenyl-phosphate mannosyltransferase [Parcubacteria group bacterium ADurb.Bin316]HOZ56402.1 glycosyltransferase family 2 protein [bacterium]
MKIICIIPAANEEEKIGEVIDEVKKFVDEVAVVDDGSTDSTAEVAVQHKATLLKHLVNRGQGAALETGNTYALMNGADIIIHFDADGQFLAEEIPDMVKPIIEDGYEVVLGSRFLGKESNMPLSKKYIIIPLARLINFLFFNVRLTDPQSGFRALSRGAAGKIKIELSDYAHCSEVLGKIFKFKLKFKEVPITVIYTKFGRNFRGGINIIRDLILGKLIK